MTTEINIDDPREIDPSDEMNTPSEKKKTAKKAGKKSDAAQMLKETLEAKTQEAKESYDRFLRVSAEFENYKKRATREMSDFKKYAHESLIKELLTVVDNLERAVTSAESGDVSQDLVLEGLRLTVKDILRIFEKFGVKPIEALDQAFDPAYHQAVMQKESGDGSDQNVLEELQRGYMIHERLLRPAMVVVSK